MIVSTTESIPGREIVEVLGLARGNIVRTKHFGRDIQAALRSLIGGTVGGYTEMLTESRDQATQLMVEDAKAQGADIEMAYANGADVDGGGLVVNASRSVLYAGSGSGWLTASVQAATALRDTLRRARDGALGRR